MIQNQQDTQLARRDGMPSVFTPWEELDRMLEFGKHMIATGLCPQAIRTPAQVVAIIQTGKELGIPPMQALRQLAVINGRVTLPAELMMAKMLQGGIRVEWLEDTDQRATLKATRPEGSYTGTFSIEDAQRAGLMGKDGWRKYQRAMLRARVISLVGRVIAPDLLGNLYTPEEMGADVGDRGEVRSVSALPPLDEPVQAEVPTLPVESPFEMSSWRAAFDGAAEATEVAQLWRALTTAFAGTFAKFTPAGQMELVEAWERAKARTQEGR